MNETEDIHGYCNNPSCINYRMLSVYPEGFCEMCNRTIIKSREPGSSFTDQQFFDLYDEGFNDPRMAKKLGATKAAVRQHRQKLGLKAHGYTRLFTDEELIDLHAQGLNDREKAKKLDVSIGAVDYHRRRLGLKPNNGPYKLAPRWRSEK